MCVLARLVYDSYEPLLTLAAAAAVTTRVRLVTMVVVGPLRSPALLAKSAASLDALSHGRLSLGVAVGAREEAYQAAGVDTHTRGRRLPDLRASRRACWEEGGLAPATMRPAGPGPLVGRLADPAVA